MPLQVGIHTAIPYESSTTEHQVRVDDIAALGVDLIRSEIHWKTIESSEGVFDWSRFDSIFQRSEAAGLEVLCTVVNYSPQWASGSSSAFVVPDAGSGVTATFQAWNADFQVFLDLAVRRYAPGGAAGTNITKWEIGNEPNLTNFWGSTVDASQYAYWYDSCYATIRAVDPDAKVGFGGGVIGFNFNGGTTGKAFLDAVLAAAGVNGAGNREVDYLAIHGYSNDQDPAARTFSGDRYFPQAYDAWNWLVDNGFPDAKVWVTEWGFFQADLAQAARFIVRCLNGTLHQMPFVEATVIYGDVDGIGGVARAGMYSGTSPDYAINAKGTAVQEWMRSPNALFQTFEGVQLWSRVVAVDLPASSDDVVVTGLPGRPKGLMALGVRRSSDGTDVSSYAASVGFSSGMGSACAAWGADEGATINCGTLFDNHLISLMSDGTPTSDGRWFLYTLDANGFTLRVTDAPSSACRAYILAVGGDAVTRVASGSFPLKGSVTSRSMAELGGVPDAVLTAYAASGNLTTYPSGGTAEVIGFGMATGPDAQRCFSHRQFDGTAGANFATTVDNTKIHEAPTSGSSNQDTTWSANADGYPVFTTGTADSTSRLVAYMAIYGGDWAISDVVQPTGSVETSSVATVREPDVVVFESGGVTSGDTRVTNVCTTLIGVGDGSSSACLSADMTAASNPLSVALGVSGGYPVRFVRGSDGVEVAAASTEFSGSGVAVQWTSVDAVARRLWVLTGSAAPAATGRRRVLRGRASISSLGGGLRPRFLMARRRGR